MDTDYFVLYMTASWIKERNKENEKSEFAHMHMLPNHYGFAF